MIADIEERLSKADGPQSLLDEIQELFSWHGTVVSIQMTVDWDVSRPKVICCVEMESYAQVYAAQIVWGVMPVGDRSFVFQFSLDPELRSPDFSDVMLWANRETFRAGKPLAQEGNQSELAL